MLSLLLIYFPHTLGRLWLLGGMQPHPPPQLSPSSEPLQLSSVSSAASTTFPVSHSSMLSWTGTGALCRRRGQLGLRNRVLTPREHGLQAASGSAHPQCPNGLSIRESPGKNIQLRGGRQQGAQGRQERSPPPRTPPSGL